MARSSERPGTTASPQAISAIAVLPFVNLSGDSAVDFPGDGIAENVINDLAPTLSRPAAP